MRPPAQSRASRPPLWRGPKLAACARGSRRGVARAVLLAALMGFGGLWPLAVRGEASKEYDLKAVLLYHFTQFVDWPATSFAGPEAPLVIGVLGHDPFGKVLDDLVRQETHDHRQIVVERYHGLESLGNCQILFIAASESRNLPRILAALHGRPVLTVGDFDKFDLRGGMIRFVKSADEKITLRINLDAAKASALNLSARLLRVAEIVTTDK